MSASDTVRENGQSWESVHVCPNCGHVINLAELDMKAITTGIVTCPSCDWSGQIEIEFFTAVGTSVATRTTAPPKLDETEQAEFMKKIKALAPKFRTELLKEV